MLGWGRLFARLLSLSGAFPKGYGLCLSPLPKHCPPPALTGHAPQDGWDHFPGFQSACPKAQRALHSPAFWRWARPWGSILGLNPVVLVNVCSLSTGSPISDCQAGPACGQAVTVVSRAWGLVGSRDRVAMLRQRAQRVFEARVDAWLMSHLCWGREGEEEWGKAPKGFPTAHTLRKGSVPSCASWVPMYPCLCPPCLSPHYLGPCPTGAAGYGERQGCGHCMRAAWRCILHACTLAWCLPMLSSVGRGKSRSMDRSTEEASQGLVSRYHPGQPWPWLSALCLASGCASHMPVSMACSPPGFQEACGFPSALGPSRCSPGT